MKDIINWSEINSFSSEDISYFLYREGKSIKAISKIRNIEVNQVKNHIISGKIKYKVSTVTKDYGELIKKLSVSGKQDKIYFASRVDANEKIEIITYIRENYTSFYPKELEGAIWLIGEFKTKETIPILAKALVNKFVNIRRMAVSALGKLESIECEPFLIRSLDDENPQVISYGIKALAAIKSMKAKEKIMSLKNKKNKGIDIAIKIYLDKVGI